MTTKAIQNSPALPFSSALLEKAGLLDPTTAKTKKIVTAIFLALAVLPIAALGITLILDGIYYAYQRIANLSTDKHQTERESRETWQTLGKIGLVAAGVGLAIALKGTGGGNDPISSGFPMWKAIAAIFGVGAVSSGLAYQQIKGRAAVSGRIPPRPAVHGLYSIPSIRMQPLNNGAFTGLPISASVLSSFSISSPSIIPYAPNNNHPSYGPPISVSMPSASSSSSSVIPFANNNHLSSSALQSFAAGNPNEEMFALPIRSDDIVRNNGRVASGQFSFVFPQNIVDGLQQSVSSAISLALTRGDILRIIQGSRLAIQSSSVNQSALQIGLSSGVTATLPTSAIPSVLLSLEQLNGTPLSLDASHDSPLTIPRPVPFLVPRPLYASAIAASQSSPFNLQNLASSSSSSLEIEEDYELILGAEANAMVGYVQNKWLARLHRVFFDPGNPEKGRKYSESLYHTCESLNQEQRNWKKSAAELTQIPKPGVSNWFGSFFSEKACAEALASSFATHATSAFQALFELDTKNPIRVRYGQFIHNNRIALLAAECLTSKENPLIQYLPSEQQRILQTTKTLLEIANHYKFTKVRLHSFYEDFIRRALLCPQAEGDHYQIPHFTSLADVATAIDVANGRLKHVNPKYLKRRSSMEWEKFKGTIGVGFDPLADSNTPWVDSMEIAQTERGSKTILILRHGSPTRDPNLLSALCGEIGNGISKSISQRFRTASIGPEYEAYIRAFPSKKILYCNFQEFEEEATAIHGEKGRTTAIQALEQKYANFHFLSLPLDGPVWKEKFLAQPMRQIKEGLKQRLLAQADGFALPQALRSLPRLEKRITAILEQTHQLYFAGKELEPKDVKSFIMLFYSELIDFSTAKLNIDMMNLSCKDDKDRGNSMKRVHRAKNLMKLGQDHNPKALQDLFFSALGPFIIKNEPIITHRLEPALHVMEHLSHLSETAKERIRKSNGITGLEILGQEVPKARVGWAQMTSPSEYRNIIEYQKTNGEKQVIPDLNFQQALIDDVRKWDSDAKDWEWNLPALKHQIERDLFSLDIQLNGRRMLSFEAVCHELELEKGMFGTKTQESQLGRKELEALKFLSMLQQRATIAPMTSVAQDLQGNALDLRVMQSPQSIPRRAARALLHHSLGQNSDFLTTVVPLIADRKEKDIRAVQSKFALSNEDLNTIVSGLENADEFLSYLWNGAALGGLPAEQFRSFFAPSFKPKHNIPLYPTRLEAEYRKSKNTFSVTQELILTNSHDLEAREKIDYPITSSVHCDGTNPATIVWNFI